MPIKGHRSEEFPGPVRPDGSPMFPYPGGYWDCPEVVGHYEGKGENAVPPDFDGNTGLSKTMKQVRCQVCGLWSCWVPRSEAEKYDRDGWLIAGTSDIPREERG